MRREKPSTRNTLARRAFGDRPTVCARAPHLPVLRHRDGRDDIHILYKISELFPGRRIFSDSRFFRSPWCGGRRAWVYHPRIAAGRRRPWTRRDEPVTEENLLPWPGANADGPTKTIMPEDRKEKRGGRIIIIILVTYNYGWWKIKKK